MTAEIKTIRDASEELGGFYVPSFQVSRNDSIVPNDIVRDVLELSYTDSIEDIDRFELTLNNWDAEELEFKYIGAPSSDTSHFEPGDKITIKMGYQGQLVQMLVGEITTLEPDFPEGGRPTLRVSGLNELHGFRREQHTWRFQQKKDSEIARWIGAQSVSRRRPGLGFRVVADNADNEDQIDIEMHNEHDIVFLLRRARAHGYTFAVRQDGNGRYLYFGPPEQDSSAADQAPASAVTYELAWGSGLLSFKPELTTANQVSEVTVRGFNRTSGAPIEATVSLNDLRPRLNADQRDVARAVTGKREVVHRPVRSKTEAKRLAKAILRNNDRGMIVGSGETLGLPQLRAGEHVRLTKLGPRFSGVYYVLQTTHSIGDGGYRTQFKARREGPIEDSAFVRRQSTSGLLSGGQRLTIDPGLTLSEP